MLRIITVALAALLSTAALADSLYIPPEGWDYPRFRGKPFYVGTPCATGGISTSGSGGAMAHQSGTSATVASGVPWTGNVFGACQLQLGTTATGRAGVGTGELAATLGNGACRFRARIQIDQLSIADHTYTLWVGLLDDFGAAPVDGVFLRYNHGVNTGKWEVVTIAASAATAVDTGVTVADETEYRIDIQVNAARTSTLVYLNEVLEHTFTGTTNIPTADLGFGINAIRTTATTAIAANVASIDYFEAICYPTTAIP